jgi:hypothetical protein
MAGYVRGGLASSHRKYLHFCFKTSKCMFERQSSVVLFIQGSHLHATVKIRYNTHNGGIHFKSKVSF